MQISTENSWIWMTLALVNAGLAQGKGRLGAPWFLVSLVFGPLATLFIVLLPRLAIEPTASTGGWQPRRFERLDWIVLGVLVAFIVVYVMVVLAGARA
jgi:hypothetical protein